MKWLKENWFKLGLVVVLLIFAGGYNFYLNEKNELSKMERLDKLERESQERIAKEEVEKKEYVANQKKACLSVYETESKKFNNVREWNYEASSDTCYITYKDPNPKTKSECDKMYGTQGLTGDILFEVLLDNLTCKEGSFRKPF